MMMNLNDIYLQYKHNIEQKLTVQEKIIFYNIEDKSGFEIDELIDFEGAIAHFKNKDIIIINQEMIDGQLVYSYFVMEKVDPYICVISHPFMTNAYWKDAPDLFIDSFISQNNQIYRYFSVDYLHGMKDYIIEFPTEIDDIITNFLKKHISKFLQKHISQEDNISILFTNTNRFKMKQDSHFILYSLHDVYSEALKKPTIANVSKKLFNDIKKLSNKNGKNSNP